jgi:hypothetical protein
VDDSTTARCPTAPIRGAADTGFIAATPAIPAPQQPHPEEHPMNGIRITGILLIVAGALALVYGGFSYTKEETAAKLGPMELKVESKEQVNVPVWAGIAAVLAGGGLLIATARKG